jgi:hypothetical protein
MLTLADAVNVAQHALKRGQQAEHNVENSLSLPRKVLHTNRFRLNGHFYIVLPATLESLTPRTHDLPCVDGVKRQLGPKTGVQEE